jgi:FHA domain
MGSGCHPFEMMPSGPVGARLLIVSAPFATAGHGREEPPTPGGTPTREHRLDAEAGGTPTREHRLQAEAGGTPTREHRLQAGAGSTAPLASPQELLDARSALEEPGDYILHRAGGAVRTMPLTRATTRIGRSLVADLRFEDPTVSRRHALIVREVTGMRLLDDRSHYGVFVNGERVDSHMLRDGDVIALGRNTLLYQHVPAPARRRLGRRPGAALPTAPRPRVP